MVTYIFPCTVQHTVDMFIHMLHAMLPIADPVITVSLYAHTSVHPNKTPNNYSNITKLLWL